MAKVRIFFMEILYFDSNINSGIFFFENIRKIRNNLFIA